MAWLRFRTSPAPRIWYFRRPNATGISYSHGLAYKESVPNSGLGSDPHICRAAGRGFLSVSEVALQLNMPKLIYSAGLAQHSTFVGVIKKCHQTNWNPTSQRKPYSGCQPRRPRGTEATDTNTKPSPYPLAPR
jgi:hypothetical protein